MDGRAPVDRDSIEVGGARRRWLPFGLAVVAAVVMSGSAAAVGSGLNRAISVTHQPMPGGADSGTAVPVQAPPVATETTLSVAEQRAGFRAVVDSNPTDVLQRVALQPSLPGSTAGPSIALTYQRGTTQFQLSENRDADPNAPLGIALKSGATSPNAVETISGNSYFIVYSNDRSRVYYAAWKTSTGVTVTLIPTQGGVDHQTFVSLVTSIG